MKRIVFALINILSVTCCSAQITLTQSDYATVGDTIIIANDTMPSISIGSTGLQTWDFTSLQNHILDTVVYLDASTTPNGGNFTSNLALDRTTQVDYFTSSAGQYTFDGFAGDPAGLGVTSSFVFTNTQTLMTFPATYLDSQADHSYGVNKMADPGLSSPPLFVIDSIMIIHRGVSNSSLDAYGNLILPTGTFDVLRQYGQEVSIDSIFIKTSDATTAGTFGIPLNDWGMAPVFPGVLDANPVIDTMHVYKWIANGEKHPLVEVITDAPNGNIISLEYQVGGAVLVNMVPADISCAGACDGEINVWPTVGIAPFLYVWDDNNAQTNATATGLCAGTYAVTVIDALNDSAFATMTLNNPAEISVQVTGGYMQCAGETNTGSISVAPIGGTGPFSYDWDNGDTTASIASLGLNSYSLTITDASGCMHDTSFTIQNPDTLMGVISTTNVLCYGESSGSASLVAIGGVFPYTYNWNNGSLVDTSGLVGAGYVAVTITDELGCSVIVVDSIVSSDSTYYQYLQPTGSGCSGIFSMMGGQSPYSYLWSNGDTTGQSCDASGYYSITMTDANGCVIEVDSIQIALGIEEFGESLVHVFPNPTAGVLTIQQNEYQEGSIIVRDIAGKEVFTSQLKAGQKVIDISGLENGHYLFHFSNDKGTLTRKIILTK